MELDAGEAWDDAVRADGLPARSFFNSRMAHTVNVYAVSARTPQ